MKQSAKLLLCRPDFFSVEYVINPWMEGNVHKSSREEARAQWEKLCEVLSERAEIELIEPREGLPDMVFTANAGLVADGKAVPARFFHPERRAEEAFFGRWFEKRGFAVSEIPAGIPFEGEGDAFFDAERRCLWMAYGNRTELTAHTHLARIFDVEVVSLRLTDSRFYHLDTCFSLLGNGMAMYFPPAFDAESRRRIEARIPPRQRIVIEEADALHFACNAVPQGDRVVLNRASDEVKKRLALVGFEAVETPLTEFMKAGGAAKCLVLCLDMAVPEGSAAAHSVVHREIGMHGHLLDRGLLERALDISERCGGSFFVKRFDLGQQQHSPSHAVLTISAPSETQLEQILPQLLELGATVTPDRAPSARLAPAPLDGVAPDEFYATTIYPTEVCVEREWIPVSHQRMDAVIVVDPERKTARCRLFRDLSADELVVVGSEGIRTARSRRDTERTGRKKDEFEFMGAGVSSERRVELVVERVGWEMRRIRESGGKIVVVAGPVVIHTGASGHLAWLVRNGYVQVLLGGNAIAVHDIEQSFFGTSLGVDLELGRPVREGHRNHLEAINTIRRCGGIEAAVKGGVLTSGVMFECVKKAIPFCLAGSIRDDGPLPETRMDLLQAQREHAELVAGADLILMLSSMLHSIGVGNMTPAGVTLVCVDINPAVVTKLMDRGSLESTGVVTDVGLFLSLLVRQLAS